MYKLNNFLKNPKINLRTGTSKTPTNNKGGHYSILGSYLKKSTKGNSQHYSQRQANNSFLSKTLNLNVENLGTKVKKMKDLGTPELKQ